jgi:hypothetical protein
MFFPTLVAEANKILFSFVGAQNGIYQLRVDLYARQYYNSISMR